MAAGLQPSDTLGQPTAFTELRKLSCHTLRRKKQLNLPEMENMLRNYSKRVNVEHQERSPDGKHDPLAHRLRSTPGIALTLSRPEEGMSWGFSIQLCSNLTHVSASLSAGEGTPGTGGNSPCSPCRRLESRRTQQPLVD